MARFEMKSVVSMLLLAACLLSGASAKIVMIGDSFSDDGHGANPVVMDALSTPQVNSGPFPAAPYYEGRFSNGRVWIELVAAAFGQELQDFATGNAITGATGEAPGMFMVQPPFANTTSPTPVLVPSALDQTQAYLSQHAGVASGSNLYVIWIGANDYLNNNVNRSMGEAANVSMVTGAIGQIMTNLYSSGAREFVVANLPDLGGLPNLSPPFTPSSMSSMAKAEASNLTTAHNAALSDMISTFNGSMANATVYEFDIYTAFNQLIMNAADYGFTDTTGMCYMGPSFVGDLTGGYMYPLCSNPDSYIFWDPVHPTKHTHAVIAAQFISNFPQFNMS